WHDLAEFRPETHPVVENFAAALRPGVMHMVGDELVKPLLVMTGHVAGNVDAALVVEVAAMVEQLFHQIVFLGNRFEFDHRHVAAFGEVAGLVQHIGNAARHAGGEVAAGLADNDDDAARHVFAAMVADALDDGGDTRIAHGEPFTGDAAEIGLALGRAVKHGIADDGGFFGAYPAVFRRTDDETAAG